jgi:hypothetical protein
MCNILFLDRVVAALAQTLLPSGPHPVKLSQDVCVINDDVLYKLQLVPAEMTGHVHSTPLRSLAVKTRIDDRKCLLTGFSRQILSVAGVFNMGFFKYPYG